MILQNCLGVSNPLYGYDTLTSSDEGLYDAMPRESNGNLYKLHDGDFKNALKNGVCDLLDTTALSVCMYMWLIQNIQSFVINQAQVPVLISVNCLIVI